MQESQYIHFLIDPATQHWAVVAGILVAVVGIVPLVRNAVRGNHGTWPHTYGLNVFRFRRGGLVPPWISIVTYTVVAAGFAYFCWAAFKIIHVLR